MIIGGEFVFAELLLAVIMSIALYTGIKYVNTTVAVIMMIIVIVNFDDNIINLPGSFIYLIEAAIDTGCAAALLFQSDLKKHFTNNLDIN